MKLRDSILNLVHLDLIKSIFIRTKNIAFSCIFGVMFYMASLLVFNSHCESLKWEFDGSGVWREAVPDSSIQEIHSHRISFFMKFSGMLILLMCIFFSKVGIVDRPNFKSYGENQEFYDWVISSTALSLIDLNKCSEKIRTLLRENNTVIIIMIKIITTVI